MADKRVYKLSAELESCVVGGILTGKIPPEAVSLEELSRLGNAALTAYAALADPDVDTVGLYLREVHGLDRTAVATYLEEAVNNAAGTSAADVLRKVRDKQTLIDVINGATEMLRKGTLDMSVLLELMQREGQAGGLDSVAHLIRDGLPEPPQGLPIRFLPSLQKATDGLYGMWAVAGEPKLGKSTFAWNLSLDLGRNVPVLYYDFENGFSVLMKRTAEMFEYDHARIRALTSNIYIRNSIRTLDADLSAVAAPALVVIDSVQKLPGSVLYRRTSLDNWVRRLEALKTRGYHVLVVSEIGRAHYGNEPGMADFKETGEIEYTADLGLRVTPGPTPDAVELHIVANRHAPHRGYTCTMTRKNNWLWREIGDGPVVQ